MLEPQQLYASAAARRAIRRQLAAGPLPAVALGEFLTNESLHSVQQKFTGWQKRTVPDQYQFSTISRKRENMKLQEFVQHIIEEKAVRGENIRFSHADYTILHDKAREQAGVVAYLFLDDWDAAWGGRIVFMKAGRTLGEFVPRQNTLLLVRKRPGVRSFVKYVNCDARRSFRILSA